MDETTNTATQGRVEGILLGLAAGDRNGGPTRMALLLAESLVELGWFDRADVFRCYFDWWHREGFDTGPIVTEVFNRIGAGATPRQAPALVHSANGGLTAGCNPAHRSVPLAMAACLPDADLAAAARKEAAITHWDALAGDVAAAVVVLCRALARGSQLDDAIMIASRRRKPQTVAALQEQTSQALSRGGFAPAVLQAAIYFVQTEACFSDALDAAIAYAGPANYCPVQVGAIGGARWGTACIPARQLQHCVVLEQVRQSAQALAQLWAT